MCAGQSRSASVELLTGKPGNASSDSSIRGETRRLCRTRRKLTLSKGTLPFSFVSDRFYCRLNIGDAQVGPARAVPVAGCLNERHITGITTFFCYAQQKTRSRVRRTPSAKEPKGPVILVGHSYGGVITEAGNAMANLVPVVGSRLPVHVNKIATLWTPPGQESVCVLRTD